MKIITNKYIKRIIMIAVIFMLYTPFHAQAFTASEVENSLMCFACRGESLNKCRAGCGDHMRTTIKTMIKEGKTKDEIIGFYVKEHGETILTTPPKRGFNLVAYILPFIGLLIGAIIAFFFVKKWGKTAETATVEPGATETLSSEMQQKIDDELSKLEEDE